MAIVLSGVKLPLSAGNEIKAAAAKRLGISESAIASSRVKKQSLDCRRKDIHFVYTLHITLYDESLQRSLEQTHGSAESYAEPEIEYGVKKPGRPVVVGAGPCGLFAALTLAKHGYKPLLLERGKSVEEREIDVERLFQQGLLDGESNVCFGAGGAGAFSDGKLVTRIKDPRAERVLETLAECGAPNEILTSAKPHTGTEHIRAAVSGMIEKIVSLGGEVRFGARLEKIYLSQQALRGIRYITGGMEQREETNALILAVGHSARDTYRMLAGSGIAIEAKPFAVGLRIEHKREFIDRAQYGEAFGHPMLGAAEYRLAAKSGGRGVYTFCMCPGGEVICSATEEDAVAVNGMSYYTRAAENSNSAVVVSVGTGDFESGVLGGVEFQRRLERAAFAQGFGAPAQAVGDFLRGTASKSFGEVKPSYRPYTYFKDLSDCLPSAVSGALKEGIASFGKQLKGFDMPEAVLTGVETRTSSPVRILRGEDLQTKDISGLYPAGEGAGYAGGICSAAVDGIRCAEALMREFARP
jgi:hypothetical protein